MSTTDTTKKKSAGVLSVSLIPDSSILMQARVAAGDPQTLKLRDVANLLLHDPVLSMEFLQSANSSMFSGAPVSDLDSALTRLGSKLLAEQLSTLNSQKFDIDDEVAEMFEVLRYNARRTSIVSLILASAIRPSIASQVRISGLFAETGHMVALMHLGKTYCAVAKANTRKNLPFRFQKDHKLDLDTIRSDYLKLKGLPARMLVPYEVHAEVKGATEVDIRACVRSAMELIEAFDNGKLENYGSGKSIPVQSNLRLLKVTDIQMEKIYKAISDYLKMIAASEQPEGASVFLQSSDEESSIELNEGTADQIKVPHYPIVVVKPKSQERLQGLSDLCMLELEEEDFKTKAVEYLTNNGFFTRVALIRIPSERDEALFDTSSGFDSTTPKKIEITDPLSPFKLFRMRIKSFSSTAGKPTAPFGIAAYAIGPVAQKADGDRMVLYADNSGDKGLTMDQRGVFRLSMSLLSSKL